MRKMVQQCLPALSLLLVVIAVAPYKFPRSSRTLSPNEILVVHNESTCTPDFYVTKGRLAIPESLQSHFPGWQFEFMIDNAGWTPFDTINGHPTSFWLVPGNEFILSGEVTGVDSTGYCDQNYPLFRIDRWSPTTYRPYILSFGQSIIVVYLAVVSICIIVSIVLWIPVVLKTSR